MMQVLPADFSNGFYNCRMLEPLKRRIGVVLKRHLTADVAGEVVSDINTLLVATKTKNLPVVDVYDD